MAAPSGTDAGSVTLVVNLTRFGDLLQSQPLIQDLHRRGERVHLVCLDTFAAALPLLRHVERAWPLPGARFMADMDTDWRAAATRLLDLARAIRREARPRRVVNLTTTLPARLLTGLLAPDLEAVRGFCLDAEGFGRNNGIWASFLNGTTASRLSAPFNLVDTFRMVGGSPPDREPDGAKRPLHLSAPPPEAMEAVDALLAEAPPETRGFAAMQLGASEARRQWPVERFAAVGDRLWREERLCPVLLGTAAELPLAEHYARAALGPHIRATGRTDLRQLAGLLQRSRLLVTNDTGTMHLAAGLGVASLSLFLASAQPWDTGPYLPGCCCLEPAMDCHPCPYNRPCPHGHACLTRVSAQLAGDLALVWLRTGRWTPPPGADSEARVWLTERDAHGFASLRCLSGHAGDDRSLWMAQQRLFWRQILDDLDESHAPRVPQHADPQGEPATPDTLPHAPAPSRPGPPPEQLARPPYTAAFASGLRQTLEQAVQLLEFLMEQGTLVGKSPRAGQLFLRNCERLQSLLDACPALRSLGGFWRELRQQRGGRMPDLLRLVRGLHGNISIWIKTL